MDGRLLAATIGLLVILVIICVLPGAADRRDDMGDRLGKVVIPRHVKTPAARPRTWLFMAICAALGLMFLGWQRPSAADAYAGLVRSLAAAITRDPATVNGYIARLHPATGFLAVAYLIGISLVVRASLTRRLAMLFHVPLYLAMSVLAQALLITAGMATGWPITPFGIEATLVNLFIGGLVVVRMTLSSFVLPRATIVPRNRPLWIWDDVLSWCAVISVVALLIVSYAFLAEPGSLTSTWQVFIPLYALSILFVLLFMPLWLLWWASRRMPVPGRDRPPVDIIIPAYNEEENIARLLRSIDVAAARYGGPVRVVVSNDGSTDATEPIAQSEVAVLRHARGEVLTAPNGGQASALNRGLAITEAEIAIRIDADCVMGPDVLVYAIPWFRDPRVGTVGAMEEPRTDTVTWFSRLRALECLFQFRFARVGQSLVDGIVVIPGTFTAFRREPAMRAGGYPVGMNGEDADLTLQIGRQGYRAVVDPRIRSEEDVPRSAGEFVEQRTRWARAGFHIYTRHMPLQVGSAGPRIWLWSVRRGFAWFTLQAGMVAPIFMVELLLTHPSYRQNVVTFALLYAAGGAVPLVISVPMAVRYRYWRSLLWMPTWFIYAYLRRLATLEAVISLPTRPFPALDLQRPRGVAPAEWGANSDPAAAAPSMPEASATGELSGVLRTMRMELYMRILVLGGDGFCGWPTSLYLSDRGHDVTIVDNLSRRKIDVEMEVQSLTPIRPIGERIAAWREVSGRDIGFVHLDLAAEYDRLVAVLKDLRPDAIVHFAEQRAAPYSMRTPDTKRYTVDNNIRATHNLLVALVESGVDAALAHLGTMGVYGYGWSGSAPIPEGYLTVKVDTPDGELEREILHPANPGSVYHMTKTLDQLLFAFYAKNDGLRITDLHQGIVWGTQTAQTARDERLINRFDYDGDYGTVLNRFLMQAAIGHPLTVHGTGGQTRAFIHIRDTVRCIELALAHPPQAGERPKVLNQVTETYQVLDLAKMVADIMGVEVAYLPNPRREADENELIVRNDQFLALGLEPTTLSDGLLAEGTDIAGRYRDRVDPSKIIARSTWRSGMETSADLMAELPAEHG